MSRPIIFVFLAISLGLAFRSAWAANPPKQELSELSKRPQWLHLLHYHQAGLFSRYESQVDDPTFFLSMNGKTDAYAELQATVQAFETNPTEQCRFPARFHWLSSALGPKRFPEQRCEKFEQWFKQIDGKGLTMVFPAAYLNSPSSMFGHTLIRIDRKSGHNPLLDFSVNYAANADPNDNELVFTYKGLSGGYPGVFSLLPYYQKVKEYSFLESRDVWEYELSLSQTEVDQFIRHIWEVKDAHFDYYFFTENCSYHLLTLLDAASPRFNFADQFYLTAIPADTVRVIGQADIVSQTRFRASTLTNMNNMLSQLDPDLIISAKQLVLSETSIDKALASLPSGQQAQVLELAYQYSRYLAVRKKQLSSRIRKRSIELLSTRSKLPEQQVFAAVPKPSFRDDEGHRSRRLESRIGNDGDNDYLQIGLRMAYHDFLDTAPGYIRGARLEMFHAQLRHTYAQGGDATRLQAIRLIDIASLSPRNAMLTPISWRVSTGFKRPNSQPNELMAYLSSGAGVSYSHFEQQFYALWEGELNADNDIRKGYRVATGPRLGWLIQRDRWSANLELHQQFELAGAKFKQQSIKLGISRRVSPHWQIRINTGYQQYRQPENNTTRYEYNGSLAAMYYF